MVIYLYHFVEWPPPHHQHLQRTTHARWRGRSFAARWIYLYTKNCSCAAGAAPGTPRAFAKICKIEQKIKNHEKSREKSIIFAKIEVFERLRQHFPDRKNILKLFSNFFPNYFPIFSNYFPIISYQKNNKKTAKNKSNNRYKML